MGELGLLGVCVPTELGGSGADFLSYVLVIEQISRGDAGLGTTLAVHTGAGTSPILAHGSDASAMLCSVREVGGRLLLSGTPGIQLLGEAAKLGQNS